MIICRSPLRISLGGGGTDLPSYYRDHGGFVIAAAIDKYVYITLHETFQQQIIVKYSKHRRRCADRGDPAPDHPRSAEAGAVRRRSTWRSRAWRDIPAGTGLGSSGSFHDGAAAGTARVETRLCRSAAELAEQACHIEIDLLGEPVGKQDQYIAAYRRHDLLPIRPRRLGRGAAARGQRGDAATISKITCSCSSPASRGRRRAILKDQDERSKQRDAGWSRTCIS